jgi:hypothetical protein
MTRKANLRPSPPQRDFHFRAQLPRDGGGWNVQYHCHSCSYAWRGRPLPDGIAKCPACGETVRITFSVNSTPREYQPRNKGVK